MKGTTCVSRVTNSRRSTAATVAPARASAVQIASPRPPAAPVTTATRFVRERLIRVAGEGGGLRARPLVRSQSVLLVLQTEMVPGRREGVDGRGPVRLPRVQPRGREV